MSTAFMQLRAAVVEHLLSGQALADGRVYAGRVRPIKQTEPSAINVKLSDSQDNRAVVEFIDWQTTLFIECCARAGQTLTGADADSVAEALLEAVVKRLADFTTSPAASGCAVLDVDHAQVVEWDTVAEDVPYTCATLRLTVTHRTPVGSLSPWA